jgi:serine O-acetyltransferase
MTSRLWRELQSDITRISGRASLPLILVSALARRCYRPLFTLRVAQACARSPVFRPLLPVCVLLHRIARHAASMDLPWRTSLGEGVRIDHGYGVVVNAGATLGNNVTLFHGVTLGQADRIAEDGTRSTAYPVIEDDVWIGPHAVIVGDVRIGRGSRIAGGAFISKSIPPHSLVMGNPARIVHEDVTPDVENPWPVAGTQPAGSPSIAI